MSADDNVKTIKAIYEAFGRGDAAFIVENVTDDVDWATDTASTAAPWYGPHHGKSGVASFFAEFAPEMTVEQFEPVCFTADDDEVNTIVKLRATRRANGRSVAMNLHHWFVFRDGKIAFYRGTEDTALTAQLFQD
jgi:ketosteroid isomerase-like protein